MLTADLCLVSFRMKGNCGTQKRERTEIMGQRVHKGHGSGTNRLPHESNRLPHESA